MHQAEVKSPLQTNLECHQDVEWCQEDQVKVGKGVGAW